MQPILIDSLRLAWVGDAELQLTGTLSGDAAQAELNRQLEQVHARVKAKGLTSYTVDVRQLTFVNSSAIRLFVNWIARAASAGYKLVFLVDRGITWHRLSFSVLKSLAPASVEIIEHDGKARVAEGPPGR